MESRLAIHQKSFDALLDLIPAKYYQTVDAEEVYQKHLHNKTNKAPKQAIKEATKKAKKRKFDPDAAKDESKSTSSNQTPTTSTQQQAQPLPQITQKLALNPFPAPQSISELRDKVKSKLEAMRIARKAAPAPASTNSAAAAGTTGGSAALPKSRHEILEKRLKRKQERREKRKKAAMRLASRVGNDTITTGHSGKPVQTKSVNNLKEDISFGKLDFGDVTTTLDKIDKDPKKKKTSDAFSLLKAVEAKKSKLEQLTKENPEKAAAIVEKEKWNKIMRKADGETVKDDPKLLKKTVKRKLKAKEHSSKEWTERKAAVSKSIMDKQKKREENLKNRSANKLKGKHGGIKKKARPGFEGGRKKR